MVEEAEDILSFDQCPLEKVVVFINGYAEVRRRATVRLNLGPVTLHQQQPTSSTATRPMSPNHLSSSSARQQGHTGMSSPNVRRSVAGVTTRRHSVVVRGLPGACLAADSLRVELLDYKATAPISLDDVQLVYPNQKPANAQGSVGSAMEPALTTLLEQQSLRDQMAHVRRRYESALARKHRLLAQRTILDRVAESMSRGASPMTSTLLDAYGTSSSLYADPQAMMLNGGNMGGNNGANEGNYRQLSGLINHHPELQGGSSFIPTPHFIDALQGFLQLYDDRTHKVDDSLADTNVELERLEDQLNHLSSLCSDADMRAPAPQLLLLTLSHFVIHNSSAYASNQNTSIGNLSIQALAEEPNSARSLSTALNNGRLSPANGTSVTAVSNSQIATVTLSISYTVYGAFWNPAYELRLRPDDSAVQLVYSVAITQSTGEDWLFEKEGTEDSADGSCTRLFVSTSHASISPAAPSAPVPDRIIIRGSASSTARKIDQLRARAGQQRMSASATAASMSQQQQQQQNRPMSQSQQQQQQQQQLSLSQYQLAQLGLSTPNLLPNDYQRRLSGNYADEPSLMMNSVGARPASPAVFNNNYSARPYSASSLSHLYAGPLTPGGPIVMYNDTNAPDVLGARYPYRAPIQHASSFAAFVTPGQSMNASTVNNSTGDYDNCTNFGATAGDGQLQDGESAIPTGIVFEADVLSACSAISQPSNRAAQYVLSSGATVQISIPKQNESRTIIVKIPTVRQAAVTPIKFVVGCHDLEVLNLRYEATPRLASSAFASAHLRNTSPLPLLAGSVAVFHDRASGSALFAYRTQLPYVSVGDDFLVALGPDPAVAIEYQAPQRRTVANQLSTKLENLEDGPDSPSLRRNRSKDSGWKWSASHSRSRSHDAASAMNRRLLDSTEDGENTSKRAAAIARWSYYRQLIGIANKHERAVVRIHLVEPLPRPADSHLRLVLEAPTLLEVDKQVENGKKVRASRKTKFKSTKTDGDAFVAKLNSNHQLEWDIMLRAGEMRYLEVRYRLELKPGSNGSTSTNTNSMARRSGRESTKSPAPFDGKQQQNNSTVQLQQQQQFMQPSMVGASSTLPRPQSAQPPRPGSPFGNQQQTGALHYAQASIANMTSNNNNARSASYQMQSIGVSSLPPIYRGTNSHGQDQQQSQGRINGIRYTAC